MYLLLSGVILYVSVRESWQIVLFRSSIALLTFGLVRLSIIQSFVQKAQYNCGFITYPFRSVSVLNPGIRCIPFQDLYLFMLMYHCQVSFFTPGCNFVLLILVNVAFQLSCQSLYEIYFNTHMRLMWLIRKNAYL